MADAASAARAEALKQQGNAAVAARKLPRAVELFTEALAADPTNHTVYSNRSGVHLDLGDAAAAEADAREAVAHAPQWAKGHFRLGAALEAQGRHDEAARAYGDALALDPGNADLAKCRDRAAGRAGGDGEPGGGRGGGGDGRPTFADALRAARAEVDPAGVPRVGRLGDLVASRHSGTLRLGADPARGRHLLAARPVKPLEVLAVEHAMFWAPPRCNDWAMTAPALAEAGPDVKAGPPGALDAWALQLAPFFNAGVARAGGSFAGRPEAALPPLTRGELLLRVLQQNSHGVPWSEGHPDEGSKYLQAVGFVCSLPNHSCDPSAGVSGVWDAKAGAVQLRLFALRAIPEGGEVTISYMPSRHMADSEWEGGGRGEEGGGSVDAWAAGGGWGLPLAAARPHRLALLAPPRRGARAYLDPPPPPPPL